MFGLRYAVFVTVIVGSLITLLLALSNLWWLLLSAVFIALTVLGVIDLRQSQSTLRRNSLWAVYYRPIFL